MNVAIIEIYNDEFKEELGALKASLEEAQLESVSWDPSGPETAEAFQPGEYGLVVNRLSATAYRHGDTVIATAYQWLAEAEAAGLTVVNGTGALAFDVSKAAQHRLLEALRPSDPSLTTRTKLYRSLEEIVADEGVHFHDTPVFLKLAAGGSGTGTLEFASFGNLREAIAQKAFGPLPAPQKGDKYPVFAALLDRLQQNFHRLSAIAPHTAGDAAFPLLVQEAVGLDPNEAVYRALVTSEAYLNSSRHPVRWVLRVEIIGGEFAYGAWMAATGYNFCQAGACSINDRPFDVVWLADDEHPVPPEVVEWSLEIAQAADMPLAGLEWIRDQWGHWRMIDLNGFSIYRLSYENDARPDHEKLYPWKKLADYLVDCASKSPATIPCLG